MSKTCSGAARGAPESDRSLPEGLRQARIYVAGHRGLVGSAILRALVSHECEHLITRTHGELELTDPD